ncbi:sensor domain-containing diguanylate cyclase [Vibrio salinus]|uniref:sensor domain-containing diguanylate cyclase n=1 Tax=Vibrio salinus TaxID=2899784 RepID=UPI001E54D197|nr:sensor domain-containing diguanylate cyclase [Vibrio salinus]MCE0495069.1 sensor domain-containing diguanylate cyclase [Vibrio salinus]
MILFVVFFLMSWSSYQVAQKSINSQIEKNSLPLTSDNIYSQVQHDLIVPTFVAATMAHDTFVRDWALQGHHSEEPIQHYLSVIDKRFDTSIAFFVVDRTGYMYLPDEIHHVLDKSHPKYEWYQQVKSLPESEPYLVRIGEDPEHTGKYDIFIDHKVYDYNGNFIGITGVGISMKKVHKMIAHYERLYNRVIYFVDRDGNQVLSGKPFYSGKPIQDIPGVKEISSKLLSSPSGSYRVERGGETVFINARLVPEFGWYLIVEENLHPSHQAVFKTFLINIGVAFVVTVLVLFISIHTQGRYQKKLAVQATLDPLTGAYNRRTGEELFLGMQSECLDNLKPMSLVMFDIDYFKSINDELGHEAGDIALTHLVAHIKTHIRNNDAICRWGGEEFVLLLHNVDRSVSHEIAERIRKSVQLLPFNADGTNFQLTVSAGVVEMKAHESLSDMVKRADSALYEAKEKGRNQICLA